jgi:predicted ribosomally synthesized peptide with nif11-like leader
MSEEQLKAFLEKVKADTSLQEKLKAAANDDAVVAIAEEAGFGVTSDDIKKAQSEIEDAELEEAAGGSGGCYCSKMPDGRKLSLTRNRPNHRRC